MGSLGSFERLEDVHVEADLLPVVLVGSWIDTPDARADGDELGR